MGKRCGEELARNHNRGVVKEEGARSDASGFITPNGNPGQLDSGHLRWNEDEVNCGLDPPGSGEGWGQWSPGVGGHKARSKKPLMHRPPGLVLFASIERPDRVISFFLAAQRAKARVDIGSDHRCEAGRGGRDQGHDPIQKLCAGNFPSVYRRLRSFSAGPRRKVGHQNPQPCCATFQVNTTSSSQELFRRSVDLPD